MIISSDSQNKFRGHLGWSADGIWLSQKERNLFAGVQDGGAGSHGIIIRDLAPLEATRLKRP